MCVRVQACECVLGERERKNTNGDETDTFPDGSANITLPDISHAHTHTHTHTLNKSEQMYYI